jgi:hypothetical protein
MLKDEIYCSIIKERWIRCDSSIDLKEPFDPIKSWTCVTKSEKKVKSTRSFLFNLTQNSNMLDLKLLFNLIKKSKLNVTIDDTPELKQDFNGDESLFERVHEQGLPTSYQVSHDSEYPLNFSSVTRSPSPSSKGKFVQS